jgi:hypothetical protein
MANRPFRMKVLKVKEWKGEEYIKPSVGLVRQCFSSV